MCAMWRNRVCSLSRRCRGHGIDALAPNASLFPLSRAGLGRHCRRVTIDTRISRHSMGGITVQSSDSVAPACFPRSGPLFRLRRKIHTDDRDSGFGIIDDSEVIRGDWGLSLHSRKSCSQPRSQLSSLARIPGGHPTSSTRGRVKLLHPDAVNRRRSAPS